MEASTSFYHINLNESLKILNNNIIANNSELNLPYAVCEIIVAICAVIGNGLVIIVFSKEKKLRRRTNYYIISLATADLLVGLFAIPFAILASIGLPQNLHACLFTVSVLVVLCTISIFCLVAVSIDRYWAILYPMGYSQNVRTKTAIGIICICWITGTLVGFLPLFGWNAGRKSNDKCIFTEVMDDNYLVFLYIATIIFPALLIAAFYAHIYRVVVKQIQQIMIMEPGKKLDKNQTSGTMLRLLGAAQKREVKATQNLSRIVIFFIMCWFPLYTINCIEAFCHNCNVNSFITDCSIILSHLNSVGNPVLYAYHLKDFRVALKNFIYHFIFWNKSTNKSTNNISVRRTSTMNNQKHPRCSLNADPIVKNPNINLILPDLPQNIDFIHKKINISVNNSITSTLNHKNDKDLFVSSNVSLDSQSSNNQSGGETSEMTTPTKLSGMELQNYKFGNITKFIDDKMDSLSTIDSLSQTDAVIVIKVEVNEETLSSRGDITENPIKMNVST
ncbi:hypothetical protein PV325_001095 [Microctonus aethiopoides]|nr:hypothetical protein PV325_001095 [Microctonus aethiopoides]